MSDKDSHMKVTGQLLRENREGQNLSLSEVAMATKISPRMLKAIEEGNLQELPAKTFLRGFVRSYASFLNMDVDTVLNTFQEEMGSTLPEPEEPAVPEPKWSERRIPFLGDRSKMTTIVAVSGIVVLIALILAVKKIVDKYEKESQVTTPPQDIVSLEDNGKDTINAGHNELKPVDKQEAEKSPESQDKNPQDKKSQKDQTSKNKKQKSQNNDPSKEKTNTKQTEAPEKTASQDSQASQDTEQAQTQEIILEALDKVKVKFQVQGGQRKTLLLKSDQVHTIKAKGPVKIKLSNGGAVNIIHNGREKGVPGDLGKPTSLKFP